MSLELSRLAFTPGILGALGSATWMDPWTLAQLSPLEMGVPVGMPSGVFYSSETCVTYNYVCP